MRRSRNTCIDRRMIQKKTMTTQVADFLRQGILSGTYKAGEQLRQERLASELGVSRIPVREALHQLHSEGFVTLVSHKGAVVAAVSLEEIIELHELRARIETWLLELAIPNMTRQHLAAIEAATDSYSQLAYQADQSFESNWRVHSALYAASGRVATIEVVGRLHQQIERYTRMMVTFAGAEESTDREHKELLALCRSQDTAQAVELLDRHIKGGSVFLIERLEAIRDRSAAPVVAAPLETSSIRPVKLKPMAKRGRAAG